MAISDRASLAFSPHAYTAWASPEHHRLMTIFGFNTDVKVGDVVYHVQSEARQRDMLLQTMVFVKGLCVGKRAVSYAQKSVEPDFSEQAMHEFLKSQHKAVLEAIQQNRVDSVLGSDSAIQDVGDGGLTLNWMNSSHVASAKTDAAGNATINFSLTPEMLQDSSVMVRAELGGKSATRKFRFKK